tara:strand:- start:50900 stop:51391 length:492 start_codon:yes stop_codon:yes gene_type:complete
MSWTPAAEAAALARMEVYRGTRHAHRRAIPGKGVDCINLVYEAFIAGGFIERIQLPAYRRSDGFAREHNYLEQHFRFAFHSETIAGDQAPEAGDAVIFQVKKSTNHCGIFLGGEIWHSAYGSGCYPEPLGQPEYDPQSFIRLTAPGYRNDPRTDPACQRIRKH